MLLLLLLLLLRPCVAGVRELASSSSCCSPCARLHAFFARITLAQSNARIIKLSLAAFPSLPSVTLQAAASLAPRPPELSILSPYAAYFIARTAFRPGYVIIQYLPLCLTCHAKPETQYRVVGGKNVENVLPYNTIMTKRKGQAERDLGPEGVWADTKVHFQNHKRRGKRLSEKNWNASMDHAQKVRPCALDTSDGRREVEQREGGRGGRGHFVVLSTTTELTVDRLLVSG